MKICLVSYPFAKVSDGTAGGAEQILRIVEYGLTQRGHETFVVAPEKSEVAGRLHAIPLAKPSDDSARAHTWATCKQTIERVVLENEIDVVHLHGFDFTAYLPDLDVPVLATLHLPIDFHYENIFHLPNPGLWFNCVSEAQRRTCPESPRLVDTVPNGIELERWAFSADHDDYAVWLGRICPEKGVHHALDAARASGVRLMLAGSLSPFPAHVDYFIKEVAPRLDADRSYLGVLGLHERSRLLRRARCLVVPSEAQETSCLVAMESLASGTPVVALRRGAVPEVVEHGRCGLVVDSADELAGAMAAIDVIDRAECRRSAELRFDARKMVQAYERLYQRLTNQDLSRVTSSSSAVRWDISA